nr:hypothetical protein [Corynebacterium xerosis]
MRRDCARADPGHGHAAQVQRHGRRVGEERDDVDGGGDVLVGPRPPTGAARTAVFDVPHRHARIGQVLGLMRGAGGRRRVHPAAAVDHHDQRHRARAFGAGVCAGAAGAVGAGTPSTIAGGRCKSPNWRGSAP